MPPWRQSPGGRWIAPAMAAAVVASAKVPPDAVCAASARDAVWAELCHMATDCGATGAENIFMGLFPKDGGRLVRGIGAARDLSEGQRFFCIPEACTLATDAEDFLEHWDGVHDEEGLCNDEMRLALFVAAERKRGNASRWAALLAALPSETELREFHPAFLPSGLLPEAASSEWHGDARRLRPCFELYMASPSEEQDDSVDFTFDEAFVALVQARAYNSLTDTGASAMFPIADLVNTDRKERWNNDWVRNPVGDEMCFIALRDIEAGEELLGDYEPGPDPRAFFMDFGFLMPLDQRARGKNGRICEGLGPEDFPEPPPDAHPVLLNYWRFAEAFCERTRSPPRHEL
mmetsp:Transcript_32803/g.94093  ORF Transcript_32803/g.94093 Transcript_32803/m.94093 type:complete len:347 (-) Transcript_32803:97-1137(-)